MPLPPLSALRPFEAAARLESFTQAATELGLTQTAVSKQIQRLEQDLGLTLFERRNRAVFLTEAGRALGRTVSAALSEIEMEADRLRGSRGADEVVLHCQLCEAFYWLMPRLSRFHERHPELQLRLISALAPLTEAAAPFDVAIQTSGRPSGSARLALTASDEIFPVCAPSLLDETERPLEIGDIASHALLSHRVVPQDWLDWEDWFAAVGMPLPRAARRRVFDSYPLVLQAAVTGQGFALGWRRTVEAMIAENKLIRPFETSLKRPTELSVYVDPRTDRQGQARKLLDWLADELRD